MTDEKRIAFSSTDSEVRRQITDLRNEVVSLRETVVLLQERLKTLESKQRLWFGPIA